MNPKIQVFALLSITAGLLAVAWAIHSHGLNHQRYAAAASVGLLLDTVTGSVLTCRSEVNPPWANDPVIDSQGKVIEQPRVQPKVTCETLIPARR